MIVILKYRLNVFLLLTFLTMIFNGCAKESRINFQDSPKKLLKKIEMALDEGDKKAYEKCLMGEEVRINIALSGFDVVQNIYLFQEKITKKYGSNVWDEFNKIKVEPGISIPKIFTKDSNWASNASLIKIGNDIYKWYSEETGQQFILSKKNDIWFYDLNMSWGEDQLNVSGLKKFNKCMGKAFEYGSEKVKLNSGDSLMSLKHLIGKYFWDCVGEMNRDMKL